MRRPSNRIPPLLFRLAIKYLIIPRVDGNLIIYNQPYARFLYFGKLMVDPITGSPFARKDATKVKAVPERDLNFSRAVNVYAQSHWFEASKAKNLQKWVRVAQKAVEDDG